MKVCILTTVDSPFDPRVFYKVAKSLVKLHDVVVIAPTDEQRVDEEIEGIMVIAVRKPANKILHAITLWRILREALKQECDVCHCHAPGGLFLGALLKMLKRSKVVYDAREHYSSLIAENSLFPDFIRPSIRFLADIEERVIIRFADVVITVDQILQVKYNKYHKNVVIISNYPRLILFRENVWSDDLESKYGKSKLLLYAGGLTKDRGTLESIQALQKIVKKVPEAKLVFLGEFMGGDEYKEEVR
ncbi:hypothetical protein C5S31_11625 [ANME-1 cluster archaeon GoMg2]|nr:hypothetical protein [ANME-1 cluster archaeon GoMg2]